MKKNILMIYPKYPATYWSLEHTLKIVNKKALMPPIGLMTVAAMLPSDYKIRLVDLNVTKLRVEDILNTDMVFISAMIVQKESFHDVAALCKKLGKPVTAGGPYPSASYDSINDVDHFVIGEAENLISQFIHDYENGTPLKIYRSDVKPDIKNTPIPRYDLINIKDYGSIIMQSSRGCPYNCEFCDISVLFGSKPRQKAVEQFISEMDAIYEAGFSGLIDIVDDNFIGNKEFTVKLLRAIRAWQISKSFPFTFLASTSIDLSAETEILDLMAECAFTQIFIGLETPDEDTLIAINKRQNVKHNILESVKTIQSKGMEVLAGFIIGFDTDTDDIFDRQINFIQESGIAMAMIGLMLVLPGTRLYRRLEKEGRIIHETCGNNTTGLDLNFIPTMDKDKVIKGYLKVLGTIYSPEKYFERSLTLLSRTPDRAFKKRGIRRNDIQSFIRSFFIQGFSGYGLLYIRFLIKALKINPGNFPLAVILSVNGHHFFQITRETMKMAKIESDPADYSDSRNAEDYELQSDNIAI